MSDFTTRNISDAASTLESPNGVSDGDYVRDDTYYFKDAIFLVEGCLFKVHRRYFEEESEVFRAMFQLPVSDGATPDGLSDKQPLRLDGISQQDFRALLKVIFPAKIQQLDKMNVNEWTSVLKLSTMWGFDSIRNLSIRQMTKLLEDPVQMVFLATTYHVDQWLLPALNSLAQREAPMSIEDVGHIGIEYVVKIAAIRESVARGYYGEYQLANSRGKCNLDFTGRIRASFGL